MMANPDDDMVIMAAPPSTQPTPPDASSQHLTKPILPDLNSEHLLQPMPPDANLVHLTQPIPSDSNSEHTAPNSGNDSTGNRSSVTVVNVVENGHNIYNTTEHDILEMGRLGKSQVYKRNFSIWNVIGFVSLYMATWEYVLVSFSAGFVDGGYADLFWTFIVTAICFSSVVASLAELESIAPTSGGMYSWASEFGPESCQKWLSYVAGWMSSLGWIASVSSGALISAKLIPAMVIVLRDENIFNDAFEFTSWQLTLLMLAFLLLAMVFNNWGSKFLPALQVVALYIHVGGWAFVIIALLTTNSGRYNDLSKLFTHPTVPSGWKNLAVVCLMRQVSVIYCNLGFDSIVHITEEVPNASRVVPLSMFWSYVTNVIAGIAMLIVTLLCLGQAHNLFPQLEQPYITLFRRTELPGLAFILTLVLSTLFFFSNITAIATASREVWAFARDYGFPFSEWISVMDTKKNIPVHAVYLTTFLAGILCLLNMGSPLAFQITVSLCLLGILSTYMLSIGCILYRRIGGPIPKARWSLGRYGSAINTFAFLYCGFVMIFACFPTKRPVTTANMNWAPVLWVAVITVSSGVYMAHGRKHYTPPVDFIRGRAAAGTELQKVETMDTDELRKKRKDR